MLSPNTSTALATTQLANLVSLSSSSRSQDHAVEQRHALQSAVPAESSKTGAIHSRSSAENLGLT